MELVLLSRKAHCLHDPATGFNSGLVVTRDGAVLIDAGDSVDTVGRTLAEVTRITSQSIAYCVLTHWPGEAVVAALAHLPLLAHGQAPTVLPGPVSSQGVRLLFAERVYMSVGGVLLEVVHTPGSTPGSCVVSVPSDALLFGGDTVRVGAHPTVGPSQARTWATSLASLYSLGPRAIIPARGPLATTDDLAALAASLREQSDLPREVEPLGPRQAARDGRYLRMAGAPPRAAGRVASLAKGAAGR